MKQKIKRKDTAVSISLPIEERAKWHLYADKKNISLSEFVRQAVRVYMTLMDKQGK